MLKYPRAGRRGAHRSSDRYSGRNAFAVSTRRSASPVTFTESDVTVGMSISRVAQHRVMSYSAGDGRELFRWPWNGRLSLIFFVLSTLVSARWSKSNGNRYVYQVFGFRNVSYALYPSPVYLWWWWRSKTAHKKLLMDPYTSE
jgi:hypothetical protein